MGFEGVCFELATSCPKCSQPVALNGATESVLCDGCRTPLATPVGFWQSVIGGAISESLALGPDEGRNATMMLGQYGLTVQAMYGRQNPRCANDACKTTFPDEALQAGIDGGLTQLHCPACGTSASQRPPPPWFAQVNDLVRLLVRETSGADSATRQAGSEPVPFHCYHCGASLPLDGSERHVSCTYCGNQLMVPDEIWVRLNPAQEKARWYAVVDTGGAVGVLPGDVSDFCAMACDSDGELIALYHADDDGEAGHPCRVLHADARGLLRWRQDGVEFDDDAYLVPSPGDGHVWIVDADERFMRLIDGETGDPRRTIPMGDDEDDPDCFYFEYCQVACDWDGTLLIRSGYDAGMRRFDAKGNRVPLWPGQKPTGKGGSAPGFGGLKNQPSNIPDDTKLRVGWDNKLYILHKKAKKLAWYDRQGTLLGNIDTGAGAVERVYNFGVDMNGVVYVLFEHKQALRNTKYTHLGRIPPGGQFEVWVGPQSPVHDTLIGAYSRYFAVAPDGHTFVAYDFEDMRKISPAGEVVWRSPGTLGSEKHQLEELAKNRKGKKQVSDQG